MRNATKVAAALAALATVPASAIDADARPVSLSDARYTPTAAKHMPPGSTWAPRACARPSDVSAYRSNGRALGQQQRTRRGFAWRSRGRVVVTFDRASGSFTNNANGRVIAAIWCDR